MRIGALVGRVVIGSLFVGHGTQKLLGLFDGPGIDGTEKMMSSLEMQPPRAHAYAVGATETVAGSMLLAGAATPLSAAALIGTMITAIRTVHLKNGPWVTDSGYEYNVVLIAALLAIVDGGPGALSVDRLFGKSPTGLPAALFSLGLGAAASAAATAIGRANSASRSASSPAPYPAADAVPATAR